MDTKTQQALDDFKKFCELLHLSKQLAPVKLKDEYKYQKFKQELHDHPTEILLNRWRSLTSEGNEDYFLQAQPVDSIGAETLLTMVVIDAALILFNNLGLIGATGIAIGTVIFGLFMFVAAVDKRIENWSPAGLDAWAQLKPELNAALPYLVRINHWPNKELFESRKYFLLEKKPKLGDKATIVELSIENNQLMVDQHTELITSIEECKSSSAVFSKLVTELIGGVVTK